MIEKKKTHVKLYAIVFLLLMYTGYLISAVIDQFGLFSGRFGEGFLYVMQSPFKNRWNEYSPTCLLAAVIVYLCFLSWHMYTNRNYYTGKEHGTAEWADLKRVEKTYRDPDPKNNRILSEHVEVSLDKATSNGNCMIVGAPGTGKSFYVVAANLLKAASSYVILDVKGELLRKYGTYLKTKGYEIKALNLKDMEHSNQYDPFAYIKNEVDVIKLVSNIHKATTPPDAMKGDPFWDDGCMLYLQSLFYYVWLEFPKSRRNMNGILELVNMYYRKVDDERSELDLAMEALTVGPLGKEHPAYRDYQKLHSGAPETVASIILMLNTKLKLFETKALQRIFADDELHLEDIGCGKNRDGKTKTALFLVIPDNDDSFDFLTGMLYTQLFDTLIREADLHYQGALPIRVEVWMDEFANATRPYRFEKLLTTLRSRNIHAIMVLQSVDQIKTIFPKADTWGVLMDACSMFVFLGAGRGAYSTHEYISKILGSATIAKRSDSMQLGANGHTSMNNDQLGRELMTPAEVAKMERDHCIILLEGCQPIYDTKYKTYEKPEYKEVSKLGEYIHPVTVKTDAYGNQTTVKPEGSLEELSEEGLEYYRNLPEKEKVNIYEIDMLTFFEMDLSEDSGDIDLEALDKELIKKRLDQVKPMIVEAALDLSGRICDILTRYPYSDEQIEEILSGMEAGLSEEDVKSYMDPDLPAVTMNQKRRLLQIMKGD